MVYFRPYYFISMKIADSLKREFLRDKWFYGLMIFTVIILIVIRSFPYVLHGPFGFGYDTGIYKKTFEDMKSFLGVFDSQIYIFPAFLAYLFNLFHLPLGILLYPAYILFSVLVAWPLYFLTKEFFGKIAGLIAVAIFTISYVQVFASEFYFFKEMLGAVFLLFGFLYYVKRSTWFYLFAVLLLVTQLPQFLILAVGTGISAIYNFKKDLSFNLKGIFIIVLYSLFLFTFASQQLINAFGVVYGALTGTGGFDPHQSGSFIPLAEFLRREWLFFILGLGGFVANLRENKSFSLQVANIFLIVVVFFELFFERRFIISMSLLLMPYAGYLLAAAYERLVKRHFAFKYVAVSVFVLGILGSTVYHYLTTYPAINSQEKWAIELIAAKDDSNYVMATSSYYAPWLYGFSGKITLAPGIFVGVWTSDTWVKYMEGSNVDRAFLLIKIANEYGKFYVMEGTRQVYTRVDKVSPLIKRIYDVNGVRIYEVSPSSASYDSSSAVEESL